MLQNRTYWSNFVRNYKINELRINEVLIFNVTIVTGIESEFIKFVITFGIESSRIWSRISRPSWLQRTRLGRRCILSKQSSKLNNVFLYLDIRNIENNNIFPENVVSEAEVTLALGYLMGDTCLYRAACEEPHVAKEYLGAAEMIIQVIKLLPQYVIYNKFF